MGASCSSPPRPVQPCSAHTLAAPQLEWDAGASDAAAWCPGQADAQQGSGVWRKLKSLELLEVDHATWPAWEAALAAETGPSGSAVRQDSLHSLRSSSVSSSAASDAPAAPAAAASPAGSVSSSPSAVSTAAAPSGALLPWAPVPAAGAGAGVHAGGAGELWSANCRAWLMHAGADACEASDSAPRAAAAPLECSDALLSSLLSHRASAASGPLVSARCCLDEHLELALEVTRRLGGGCGCDGRGGGCGCGCGCGGGSGSEVYEGVFRNAPAAIKISKIDCCPSKAVAQALEMAVLSGAPHPNIIRAYACLPDMALLPDAGTAADGRVLRFSSVVPLEEDASAVLCNVVITELCDRGTLEDALARGVSPAGHRDANAAGPWAAGALLLDVAAALQYLHSIRLVHGDVTAGNVLVKSDPTRQLGLQAKLSGFGRAALLQRPGRPPVMFNAATSALAFAAAPGPCTCDCASCEGAIAKGTADDVFAFGALMLAALNTRDPASGAAAPPCPYAALASECLSADPPLRPTMAAVASRLERILAGAARGPIERA